MGTDCLHCQEALPDLDFLASKAEFPPVVAFCTNDETERAAFEEQFQPLFPLKQIAGEDFWTLLGEGHLPRIMFLREGRVLKVWDQRVPGEEEIRALILPESPSQ